MTLARRRVRQGFRQVSIRCQPQKRWNVQYNTGDMSVEGSIDTTRKSHERNAKHGKQVLVLVRQSMPGDEHDKDMGASSDLCVAYFAQEWRRCRRFDGGRARPQNGRGRQRYEVRAVHDEWPTDSTSCRRVINPKLRMSLNNSLSNHQSDNGSRDRDGWTNAVQNSSAASRQVQLE